ncbi:MAG: DNA-3-methyladenine glycosylase I [Marinovum sp.]|nr:DNA-3-methyladenine glycosylase I [Marinovum sp.]
MRHFHEIYAIAEDRHGAALADRIGNSPRQESLKSTSEDRWLSRFSQNVFNAGFNWSVIEKKWPDFEEAFHGFDVGRCALMDDAWFDELIQDTRIVRHGAKIQSVRDNAAFLLDMLKKRGTRLGGTTGQYALRFMGKDSFILSRDVVGRLVAEGVIDKVPTSKGALTKTQEAFNTWMDQSGRSLTHVSRVLALSI